MTYTVCVDAHEPYVEEQCQCQWGTQYRYINKHVYYGVTLMLCLHDLAIRIKTDCKYT